MSIEDLALLGIEDVMEILMVKRSRIYQLIAAEVLPRPIRLVPGGSPRWRRQTIADLIEKREAAASRGGA